VAQNILRHFWKGYWKRGTKKLGTKMQGWKTQDWNTRDPFNMGWETRNTGP